MNLWWIFGFQESIKILIVNTVSRKRRVKHVSYSFSGYANNLGPLLLTCFNFKPNMGNDYVGYIKVEWNYWSIPILPRWNHWSLEWIRNFILIWFSCVYNVSNGFYTDGTFTPVWWYKCVGCMPGSIIWNATTYHICKYMSVLNTHLGSLL